jgi:hypothetical protein
MIVSKLITAVRSRVVEPTARFFQDSEIIEWLNWGYKDFVVKASPCEKIVAIAAVATQRSYLLPAENLIMEKVKWQEKWIELCADESEFRRRITLAPQVRGIRPVQYTQYPAYGPGAAIMIWPAPSSNSPSTTLTSVMSTTATTLTVASTTGFPLVGYLLVNGEQIRYDDTDATHFKNCVRGDAFSVGGSGAVIGTGTTGAINDVVTAGELSINLRYMPPDLVNTGDSPRIPDAWQEALVFYATKIGLEKLDKIPQAGAINQQYIRCIEMANSQRQQQQYDKPFAFQDESQFFYPYQ